MSSVHTVTAGLFFSWPLLLLLLLLILFFQLLLLLMGCLCPCCCQPLILQLIVPLAFAVLWWGPHQVAKPNEGLVARRHQLACTSANTRMECFMQAVQPETQPRDYFSAINDESMHTLVECMQSALPGMHLAQP
jgi:hypothetical protein